MRKLLLLMALGWCAGCSTLRTESSSWPQYQLVLERETRLNPPQGTVFQASGLTKDQEGRLLTVHDRGAAVYQIVFQTETKEARLMPFNQHFLQHLRLENPQADRARFDCEGVAIDEAGRFYICEESARRVLRFDPALGKAETLNIDWAPVRQFFSSSNPNASLEGVAVGGGRLYLANERQDPVIVVVDLSSLAVVDHFVVRPRAKSFFGMHYSGLAWHGGRLFVLLRQHRVILEVDPGAKKVLAEYDYRQAEEALRYQANLPVGIMEGLAVDDAWFWMVTDNNGEPRRGTKDARPTLLQFRRPGL